MGGILLGGKTAPWPVALAFFALLFAIAAPAHAEEGVFSYYMGLRAIGTQSMIDDVETPGFTGAAVIQNDSDVVGGVGLVFGTKTRDLPIRLELEVAHRFRFDLDVRENRNGTVIDNEINVASTSAMVSAIVEWRNRSSFTPFVGGSIGWARNSAETERIDIGTQVKTVRDTDTDNFAWGGTLGVDWFFAENWSAQAAYRYIDLGKTETGPGPTGESIKGGSYTSHDLLLGVFFHF